MNTAMPAITHAHIIGQVQQEPGTGHDRPPTEKKNKKNKKNKAIGVLGLASLAFFAVAGSPAGSEDTIAAAGPRLGLAGFLLMPLVWSIPEAMITAELATAFPHNGGYVVWVTEAFGERLGYQEGLLKWVSGTLDNAVYPVMMLNYVMKITTAFDSDVAQMAFPIAVVVVLSTAQVRQGRQHFGPCRTDCSAHATSHAPCDVLYCVPPCLLGADACNFSDVCGNPRLFRPPVSRLSGWPRLC